MDLRYPIGGLFALSPDRRWIAIARNGPSAANPNSSLTVLHLRSRRAVRQFLTDTRRHDLGGRG